MSTNADYLTAKGWLTERERRLLARVASQTPAVSTILNIGVEFGASVHCIYAGNPTATILAVDIAPRVAENLPPTAEFIHADSSQMQIVQPLSMAFIDGDHGYNGVLADCRFAELLTPGSAILFHDCYAWEGGPHKTCPEVNDAVTYWQRTATKFHEQPPIDSIRWFICQP